MATSAPADESDYTATLLRELRPRIRATFGRFRIPPQDAEDILQDALLVLISKRASVHSPQTWFLGTLRNRCLLYWRSHRRRLYDAVDTTLLEAAAGWSGLDQERTELQCDLRSLIGGLPPKCQSLLKLRYSMGFAAPETADQMGYRPSSIRKVTLRCIAALTRKMTAAGISTESCT